MKGYIMNYAIRLKSKIETGMKVYLTTPRATISEHMGTNNEKPLLFSSIADAEVYAQNHEINDYNVESL